MKTTTLLLLALLSAPAPAASGAPEGYAQIRRELRIGADVMRSALTDLLPESRRVVEVEAGYLADQGVLVIVDLSSPWFRMEDGDIDIDREIKGLEDIPDMVHEILRELNLGLSRHQERDLDELRAIRDAERAVRAEQRALRAELREARRALLRAEGTEAETVRRKIDDLQSSLAAAEEEERGLREDAGTVRETLKAPATADHGGPMPGDVDLAVAESVCSYGATFRSLAAGQRLNVLVRHGDTSRYYVFRMAPVRACQTGEISAEALLEESFAY